MENLRKKGKLDNSPNDMFWVINQIEKRFEDIETLAEVEGFEEPIRKLIEAKNLFVEQLAEVRDFIDSSAD